MSPMQGHNITEIKRTTETERQRHRHRRKEIENGGYGGEGGDFHSLLSSRIEIFPQDGASYKALRLMVCLLRVNSILYSTISDRIEAILRLHLLGLGRIMKDG